MARNRRPQNDSKNNGSGEQTHASPGSPSLTSTTNRLKALSKPIERANKGDRRQLQAQHNASVRKSEDDIRDSCKSARTAQSKYRRTQLDRLLDLVNRKAEIETKIVAQLHSLKELYKDASEEMELVATRLSGVC